MTRVIVTRPVQEAAAWGAALQSAGWSTECLPLIDIRPPADVAALQHAQRAAGHYDALMFVSAQAVQHFVSPAWLSTSVRCWAPGPGTARALKASGVSGERIDQPPECAAQFDSEALWAAVASQVHPGHRLLIVRGQSADGHEGRDWLLQQCRGAGGVVDTCIAYRRDVPTWDESTRARVWQWLQEGAVWLLSSSEGIRNLGELCPDASWGSARALVTHPRIEMSARCMGFGEIITTRPALADVLQGLEAYR